MSSNNLYKAMTAQRPKRLPHYEFWSNPDAECELTGIDYYKHPRQCRIRMNELYPQLALSIPESDEPVDKWDKDGADKDAHVTRWGAGATATWQHGEAYFKDEEDVLSFSPLKHPNFSSWPHVVDNRDFSSVESIYRFFCNDGIPPVLEEESTAGAGCYNTMFMWPLLSFGWELFLACCLDERFERVMDEFAELNRREFTAFAKLPYKFVYCHDDICLTRGMVCSPEWMNKYIYPRYEEFFSIVKAAGKKVFFTTDGCADDCVDNLVACGVDGIITEPYTDFRRIAKKYPDLFLAGEGDNRILLTKDSDAIRKMVEGMVETAEYSNGYAMSIGNHIPWNVPAESVKMYLDYSDKLGLM